MYSVSFAYHIIYSFTKSTTPLYVQQLFQPYNQENIKDPHYWHFVSGIHRSPVASPHKGPWWGMPFHGYTSLWGSTAMVLLYTLDISRYNITRYSTQYKKFEDETLARYWTQERHSYLALTGEPWVSFVTYLEKRDRKISGVYCKW